MYAESPYVSSTILSAKEMLTNIADKTSHSCAAYILEEGNRQ